MLELLGDKNEKKVEYVELIYDLIFVYLVGRNNTLLHSFNGGFFSAHTYFTYIISTLVILQVWYFSSLYINRYGTNSVSDHIFLFFNMYLLYYLAAGIRTDWDGYFARYNMAWGLILLNLALQYGRQLYGRRAKTPWEISHLRYHIILLIIQAAIIFGSIPLYVTTRYPFSWLTLVFGFVASAFTVHVDELVPVNAEHMTERVMLFVVFTFGETIVGLADYFGDSGFSLNIVYFSAAAFLIVVGLFISYGYLYNRVIDREGSRLGMGYLLIHIVLIVALNNITVALEFMREPEVAEIAKNVFMVLSVLTYYFCLFSVGNYAKEEMRAEGRFFIKLIVLSLIFVAAMAFIYQNAWLSIAVSVVYVYAMFALIHLRWRPKRSRAEETKEDLA